MNPKGRINNLRRKTTRFFSKIFVSDKLSEGDFSQNITQVKKVLVSRPNHRLGNNLLLTPLITEILSIEFISTLGACSMPHSWSSSLTSLFMITILLLCKPFITGFDK